jgi:GWxTD domain-containing protein
MVFIFPIQTKADKQKANELPSIYKNWLKEEVVYIITPKEREVFFQLGNDKERDLFIEAFWRHRDPTPGTLENEFKTEHYRRIGYVNKFFGRETYLPGWKTDRGNIYIILGEPLSIERFEGVSGIHPIQIWFYQGSPESGLPPQFNVVFYKKEGTGDYLLYRPSLDGPASLLSYAQSQTDPTDTSAAYNKLFELAPTVAANSLSLVPGEQLLPGQVSLTSNILLNNIRELPQRKISPSYAEALLKYKDKVEVEYSFNYVESDFLLNVIKDDSDIFFVHYSIEPKRLSINANEGKYYANFKVNGNVQDSRDKTIFQYEKDILVEFSKNELEGLGYQTFALQDMFPLVSGSYKLSLLVKNTATKEFFSFEKEVFIPLDTSSLQMSRLLLGYKTEKISSLSAIKPFQVRNAQIWAQPYRIFLPSEKLSIYFQIFGLTEDLKKNGFLKFTFYKDEKESFASVKNINEYSDNINFLDEFDLVKFSPGRYEIRVSVMDKTNNEILFGREDFEITPVHALPRPLVVSKTTPIANKFIFLHMLGIQWFNKGEATIAKDYLEKAYRQDPEEARFAIDLSRVLFLLKEFSEAKKILLSFFNDKTKNYSFLEPLARTCQALGEFKEATSYYKEHLTHYGTNLEILNSVGECYYNLGRLDEALYAWEKSLKVNPKQEKIKEKIRLLKAKEL